MKVLLDTNIWISGLLWGGYPRKIIELADTENITLYISLSMFEELEQTLAYPKLQRRLEKIEMTANFLLSEVRQLTQFCQPLNLPDISDLRDAKDKKILEAALSVPVEVIISGDEDLLVLEEFQQIPILTVSIFWERYKAVFGAV